MKKENFFTHKFLPILAIVLFILNIIITNISYGANKTLLVDNYNMSDIYNYFTENDAFYIAKVGNDYLIYVPNDSNYKSYCAIVERNQCIAYFNSNWESLEGNNYKFYKFNKNTLKFEYSWTGAYDFCKYNDTNMKVLYASKGIYNPDHESFFLQPPVTLTQIIMETLGEMMQKIIQNMKTIMTVGLVVLSIGLVIYLIKSVISRVT